MYESRVEYDDGTVYTTGIIFKENGSIDVYDNGELTDTIASNHVIYNGNNITIYYNNGILNCGIYPSGTKIIAEDMVFELVR
jgi:hypothetical protein